MPTGNAATSLVHLVRRPTRPSPDKPPLLLLLHGIGSNESDLMALAPYLDGRFFVASARAPITLQPGAYAWFHVEFTAQGPTINPEEAERSRRILLRFVGELIHTYDVDPTRVFLMGFSQGAIMSLAAALTEPEPIAGVVAMSGRLLLEVLPRIAAPERLEGLPIFVAHGTEDNVLPIGFGRSARDRLAALPVALTYREYPMAHEVSQESLGDIAGWLTTRLDGEPPR